MSSRIRSATAALLLTAACSLPGPSLAAAPAGKAPAAPAAPAPKRIDTAVFAGGCFWCLETAFEGRPGIVSVVSGYTGGKELNPTYEQVSSHATGHLESIEVRFDPAKVSYAKVLDLFWHSIDPTQGDGQFCDLGHQYQSAIFARDDQRAAAEASKRALAAAGVLRKPIVTEILPAGRFWPAEDYHQDFWKKDPVRYRTYRFGCGRDRRLAELWGKAAVKPLVH